MSAALACALAVAAMLGLGFFAVYQTRRASRAQSVWIYCACGKELHGEEWVGYGYGAIQDDGYWRYRCTKCGRRSTWLIGVYPFPHRIDDGSPPPPEEGRKP